MFQAVVDFIRDLYRIKDGVIPLHAPVFLGNEKQNLIDCIDSTFVSSVGKFVDQFEAGMAEYTHSKYAIACVNGTNALHLALKLVGVAKGDEVITQPLTFIATANAISYCSAIPVFLDVDPETLGLSPEALLKFIENQTYCNESTNQRINALTNRPVSACVPMHTFGHPCRIDEIIEICNHYNIPVVEDAAESLGSFFNGQHTGTFGKIGILSFNGNKVLTTGGGGMLLIQDRDLAKKAKHLTTQAKISHPWEYRHDEIGYNYRMPNINAALGAAQLEQLDGFLKSKRLIATLYGDFFKSMDIPFIYEPKNASSNYWLNCILLKNKSERDTFLKYTNDHGVMTRPAWHLINKLDMFRDCQADDLKTALDLSERLVNLPSSPVISDLNT